jgi:hypothetical protein
MNIFGIKKDAIQKAINGLESEIVNVQESIESKQFKLKEIQIQKIENAEKEKEFLLELQIDLDLKLKKQSQIEILKSL